MNDAQQRPRSVWPIGLTIALFVGSGGTSLIYETIWARHLHLVFGTSQLAICTLLAAFMAGLAAGAFLAGRYGGGVRRPLVAYGLLEIFIALYALAFPHLLETITPLYSGFWRAFEPSPLVFAVYQFLLTGILLLPPTVCMGATLPILVRFVTAGREENLGRNVGRLYGANTLGAVLGTAIAGFILLPTLGLATTTWAAVAGNALLAAAALLLATLAAPTERAAPDQAGWTPGPGVSTLIIVAGISGFCGLMYEVAWFRLMVLVLGASVYAFTIMLLAFLFGIGVGGWLGGASADRALRRGGVTAVVRGLIILQTLIALMAWATMYAYGELPVAFVFLFDQLEGTPSLIWPAKLLLALLVMVPPALLMGATFPYLVRAAAPDAGDASRPVGILYSVNTIGAVVGAFAGGFLILPALHVQGTVTAAAAFNVVAALILAFGFSGATPSPGASRPRLARWAAGGLILLPLALWFRPTWDPLLMTSAMYHYATSVEDRSRDAVRFGAMNRAELLFYDEGLSSVVTVGRQAGSGVLWLANNGKADASTGSDMRTQLLLAHLPALHRPRAERVLVIGLASGITAGAMAIHESPQRIDVVEIEPAVVAASHLFDDHNGRPLEDPRVHLILNDARNHLQLSPDASYDLVISEPSNPWITGVSSLFTREFFVLGKKKLAPNGVWAQWLHAYRMSSDDLLSLLSTFAEVYEHAKLFRLGEADIVVLGSDGPLGLTVAELAERIDADSAIASSLAAAEITRAEDLIALYYMGRRGILSLAGDVERNTDDNMRIEFSAPLYLHRATTVENTLLLRRGTDVPFEALESTAALVALTENYIRDGDLGRAAIAMAGIAAEDADRPAVMALAASLRQMMVDAGATLDRP